MKIQLKRSNVLNGGVAKEPTASQMEYGELAVNYNAADPAIFLEDDTGTIIRIAGAGSYGSFDGDYNNLDNKPVIGDGSITINNADGSENATFTVNQTGDTTVTLPAGFSGSWDDLTDIPGSITGDYNDLTNKLTAGDGIDINGSNVVSAVAQDGKGIAVEATGIRIGDDWSNIPALT